MKRVVKFTNVSKQYSLFKKKSDQLLDIFAFKKPTKTFNAVSNVSFEVFEGEAVGIIGTNGSGKSTLSNLLAQVIPPTRGSVEINGEPTLVAISAGLNNHLTGYENIELKCLMHGLSKSEIKEVTPAIVEFADIGEFIDQPIKSYSSGMKARLGFAISVHIKPDILIIDEALSVGDSTFHQKCVDKFKEFKAEGKTIFFISHSLAQVKSISDRIIWMSHGQLEMFDDKETVSQAYTKYIDWFNKLDKNEKRDFKQNKLTEQMKIDPFSPDPLHGKTKGPFRIRTYLQILSMLILLIGSGALMFVENPGDYLKSGIPLLKAEEKPSESISKGTPNDEKTSSDEVISERGYVVERTASLYDDGDLNQLSTELPFATSVFVKKRIDDTYLVVYNDNEYYLNSKSIQIGLNEEGVKDLTLGDLEPAFPDTFASSYEYFFAFMNKDMDELESSFDGFERSKEKDELSRVVFEFPDDGISYAFNENKKAETIKLLNVNLSADIISSLTQDSLLLSSDKELYYFTTADYDIFLDEEKKTLTFKLNSE
ncbi:ATP-binding cassette domain-containing protein [Halobacillus litoralis]|uniref:ATP-binding cassette domain-containing protein n=1 Tax=Halobacillus litoralis TaxID=45668 RepID=UPI001CFCF550|nr:ATP-binding cassette domain-containing protein [Halobacillus litoralis]